MPSDNLEFRSLTGLWQEYASTERSHAFQAGYLSEAEAWQVDLRQKLTALLGGFPEKTCDLASRPLLIESGSEDTIFPVEAARKAFAKLQNIFREFEASDRLDIDIFEGEHAWSGALAYDWLTRWLNSHGGIKA